jgi:hypothetical protein
MAIRTAIRWMWRSLALCLLGLGTLLVAMLGGLEPSLMDQGVASADALRQLNVVLWAVVVLTLLSAAVLRVVEVRMVRWLALPIEDLLHVLQALHKGHHQRRTQALESPRELQQIARLLNRWLDDHLDRPAFDEGPRSACSEEARELAWHLVEGRSQAAWVLDTEGRLLRASPAGMDRLAGPDGEGLRALLAAVAGGPREPLRSEGLLATPVGAWWWWVEAEAEGEGPG